MGDLEVLSRRRRAKENIVPTADMLTVPPEGSLAR